MLPLASRSPSLLLALLALSAEHYQSKADPAWPLKDGFVSSNYRDRSLQLLAHDLRTEVEEHASAARQMEASGILATILVLCNLEMIRCDSATWHVHWKAARTITKRWTAPHLAATVLDDTCRFLLKEAFVYDVFGSSTTFGDVEQIPSSVLTEADAHLFTDWLQLVQNVTCAERRRHFEPAEAVSPELFSMRSLQQLFERARDRSLHFSQTFDFGTSSPPNDFAILINIFHFAGLAYSFQALLDIHDLAVHKAIDHCVSKVMNTISQIEDKDAYEHDLVWPLFVIGTHSRDNEETQEYAQTKLLEVMKSTGFSNCLPALEFLRRFWASDPSIVLDWMQLAREESRRGQNFLVI